MSQTGKAGKDLAVLERQISCSNESTCAVLLRVRAACFLVQRQGLLQRALGVRYPSLTKGQPLLEGDTASCCGHITGAQSAPLVATICGGEPGMASVRTGRPQPAIGLAGLVREIVPAAAPAQKVDNAAALSAEVARQSGGPLRRGDPNRQTVARHPGEWLRRRYTAIDRTRPRRTRRSVDTPGPGHSTHAASPSPRRHGPDHPHVDHTSSMWAFPQRPRRGVLADLELR